MQPDQIMPSAWPAAACRHGRPRDTFRDLKRERRGRHIACVGGTETFGKFVDRPWPELLEERLELPCLNLGIANASVEASLREDAVLGGCRDAAATVIEVTGAHNLSNRFYTAHPRRNDRFLAATEQLRTLYPEVDFADFCFTRHLLRELHALSPERFEVVRAELRQVWSVRMRALVARCGGPVHLLWFAEGAPGEAEAGGLGPDPLFVTPRMLAALAPLVAGMIVAVPSPEALIEGALAQRPGRPFGRLAHEEVAAEVAAALESVLRPARAGAAR